MSGTPMQDEAHMRDLQFARDKLPIAQRIAPETTGVMIDSDGNWFGHKDGIPTTTIVEGDELPERL
jgi:hypothetical protein